MADILDSGRFAKAISDLLEDYADEVKEIMAEEVPKAAKKAAKELRKGGSYDDTRTGGATNYTKSWKAKNELSRMNVSAVIYNEAAPGLAHLLEKGHLMRNGERSNKFEHIAPIAEATEEELEKLLREALE